MSRRASGGGMSRRPTTRRSSNWPPTRLTKKSKDLQLAAWLTEAWLSEQGVGGLADGLDLMRGMLENFWDSLYPELEDGDAEMRATPLEWVGSRLGDAVKHAPLTRSGLDWFGYKLSRSVPYETEAAENESKAKARENAVADGKTNARGIRRSVCGDQRGDRHSISAETATGLSNRSKAWARYAMTSSAARLRTLARCGARSKRSGRRCASCWPSGARRLRKKLQPWRSGSLPRRRAPKRRPRVPPRLPVRLRPPSQPIRRTLSRE